MARFTELSPEVLKEIALYLLTWSVHGWNEEIVQTLSLSPWSTRNAERRPTLFSMAKYKDVAWVKEKRESPEALDEEEEPRALVELLQQTKQLERLTIHHPQEFRVIETTTISTSQLRLPRPRWLRTSWQVNPHNLLSSCTNLEIANIYHEFSSHEARKLIVSRSHNVTFLVLNVKKLSVPLLKNLARLRNLEDLAIETHIPHRNPWNVISVSVLGGSEINVEEGDNDQEDENKVERRCVATPIAKALPNLQEIG
ncbi:hypothetical protein EIP86_000627 [Pleurotus ostreatoroseus]|nr:hypothetical protein EIP86_000627 [Pleurotus ostreatoroseus]